MRVVLDDPERSQSLQAARRLSGADARDEVWEGRIVVSPLANPEHQLLVSRLTTVLTQLVDWSGLGQVLAGCNVSDRAEGWQSNYRIPDIAVFLKDGVATLHQTHAEGGPDFVVEILSDDDPAREKLPFYARNGVREVLLIHRSPWLLELYRNDGKALKLVETSTIECPATVTSQTVPICLRLIPGETGVRPAIEVKEVGGGFCRNL